MQAKYFTQKQVVESVSNDDEYLGVDSEISPEVIDLMSLQQETIVSQNTFCSVGRKIKLDEYELAMAS